MAREIEKISARLTSCIAFEDIFKNQNIQMMSKENSIEAVVECVPQNLKRASLGLWLNERSYGGRGLVRQVQDGSPHPRFHNLQTCIVDSSSSFDVARLLRTSFKFPAVNGNVSLYTISK